MAILVIAEHDETTLLEATARTVAAALKIGGDIDVVVAGDGVEAITGQAARLAGVRSVLHVDAAHLRHRLDEPLSGVVLQLADAYEAILFPATSSGKGAAPRVAALLDVMQISEVVEVVDALTFKRPIYAGSAIQTIRSSDSKIVATIRPSAFAPVEASGAATVRVVSLDVAAPASRFIGATYASSERPELTGAGIVVSGGRALGSAEQFSSLISALADTLGAAIGASRAAVDAGYAPNDWQVGQTGKIVAPDLYVAIGISGAIQHVAGMKDAKVVVAINSDANAPIFQYADYGLVGDLFDLVPELTAALASRS